MLYCQWLGIQFIFFTNAHLSSGFQSVYVFDTHLIKLIIINEILKYWEHGNLLSP